MEAGKFYDVIWSEGSEPIPAKLFNHGGKLVFLNMNNYAFVGLDTIHPDCILGESIRGALFQRGKVK